MFSSFIDNLRNVFFRLSHSLLLPLRYKIELVGAECLDPKKGGVNSSILFLANHSSHIDGTILSVILLQKKLPLSVWALDETFKLPYLRWAARHKDVLQVVKVPNINEVRSEKHLVKLHKLISRTGDGLKEGRNFLIFPSGRCKKTPLEKIDGKSAVPLIIQQCPGISIVLIRVTGLWGSRFSGAVKQDHRWATRNVRFRSMLWQSIKMLLLNGIFFIPKRKVLIEMHLAGEEFPRFGTRMEINRYLETYFNQAWGSQGEPLYRVPDYFWKMQFASHEYQTVVYHFDLDAVSKPMRNAVVKIVADKCDLDSKDLDFSMNLGRDLGLDSLDLSEILTELECHYEIPKLVPEDLTTLGHLIAIVANIPIAREVIPGDFTAVSDHIPVMARFKQRAKSLLKTFNLNIL